MSFVVQFFLEHSVFRSLQNHRTKVIHTKSKDNFMYIFWTTYTKIIKICSIDTDFDWIYIFGRKNDSFGCISQKRYAMRFKYQQLDS